MHYRVGTRGSKLALVQTEIVIRAMEEAYPGDTFEAVVISTRGDQILDKPLYSIGGKGIFVEEIEKQLLEDSIQLAVHSMKDMPENLPEGLTFARAWKREDARDVLITRSGLKLAELPEGAILATGSKRRAAELHAIRPDIRVVGIRGNVDTRLRKLMDGMPDGTQIDGIVIAAAGILRLGREDMITEYLDPELMTPSPCQGTLGIELRADHTELLEKLNALSDDGAERAVQAERAFLAASGGNCHLPVGAYYTEAEDGSRTLRTVFGNEESEKIVRTCVRRTAVRTGTSCGNFCGDSDGSAMEAEILQDMVEEALRETDRLLQA